MLTLTKEDLKSHQDAKISYICGKRFLKKFADDKSSRKVTNQCYYADAAHSIFNLKFNVYHETPLVFHNVSNYDYYFIIKELINEFEGQCECPGQNYRNV